MDTKSYLESLGMEMLAIQKRVRNLIASSHWQTDGEWKESVVRQMLRRSLPANAQVSRGFIVSADGNSHQIDVLIHDNNKPVIFQDGDLVFVTPDTVLATIEVKSRLSRSQVSEAATKLGDDIALVRNASNDSAIAGLFAFEFDAQRKDLSRIFADAATDASRRTDIAALGVDSFIRHWRKDPQNQTLPYDRWHSYDSPKLAFGLFLHNVVDAISPTSVAGNHSIWYLPSGKENMLMDQMQAAWA